MAVTTYLFNINSINPTLLDEEIKASQTVGPKYLGLTYDTSQSPDLTTIYTDPELTSQEADDLSAILVAHDGGEPSVIDTVESHKSFGAEVIDRHHRQFVSEDLYTDALVLDVASIMSRWRSLAELGDLYALDADAATTVPLLSYLTAANITLIRNEIRAFLGLPPV